MLEAYSTNIVVAADAAIPFNNITLEKGCTAELSAPSSLDLNKCGVYMVAVDAVANAATTIQLYKDGVAQPQAQFTGTAGSFVTLVQVDRNNSNCNCCSSPVNLKVTSSAEVTLTNANIVVTKIC